MTELITGWINLLPPAPALFGQLLVGLINGSFYAVLSLGLAVIFGLLNIVNFTHGAQYMLGGLAAYALLTYAGIGYWPALVLAPLLVGATGIVMERLFLRHLYKLDHLYGMLLTFGVTLVIEGLVRYQYGSTGSPYPIPTGLNGAWDLGFMFMPIYRGWVVVAALTVCLGTWFVIEKTKLGAYLRAATENPKLTRAFGINVPRMVTLTYGFGVALAALAGVMAAPIYQINANMGSEIIIVVFAVVVIGGMGSIKGAIVSGFVLGLAEGMTKVFYPEASTTVVFIIMAIVLLIRPAGLFGAVTVAPTPEVESHATAPGRIAPGMLRWLVIGGLAVGIVLPLLVYPVFLMKVLCFAIFACAFNLLMGYGGLLSFGHAAFYGGASYFAAYAMKAWGFDPLAAVLGGGLLAGALGLAFGHLAIRRQGIYFAMITLALAQMVYFFAVQAEFTGNDEGIQGVPRGRLLGLVDLADPLVLYYFVFACFVASFAAIARIIDSPFGQVLKGIRDNEPRAISLGYEAGHYKLVAFVLSAAFTGVAGALDALVFQLASLTNVHWTMSGHALLMTILGGVGTLTGPVVGAIIVAGMENYLAQLGSWVAVIHGCVFIVCVMMFRAGIVGEFSKWLARRRPNRKAQHPQRSAVPIAVPGPTH
jgi:branched-chain amino acid transport system permease protein